MKVTKLLSVLCDVGRWAWEEGLEKEKKDKNTNKENNLFVVFLVLFHSEGW